MAVPKSGSSYGMSSTSKSPAQTANSTAPSKPSTLGASDLNYLIAFAQRMSPMLGGLGMMMTQQQNALSEALNMYAERMKASQDREAIMKKLQDAIAKTVTEMQKDKIQAAQDINKNIAKYLLGGG